MRDTTKYGRFYWCVKVPKTISEDREIYVCADHCSVEKGVLTFWHNNKDEHIQQPNLILGPGNWSVVYAASALDGHPVAIDHWKEEVVDSSK